MRLDCDYTLRPSRRGGLANPSDRRPRWSMLAVTDLPGVRKDHDVNERVESQPQGCPVAEEVILTRTSER